MKRMNLLLSGAGLASLIPMIGTAAGAAPEKPNVVIFFTDDQGAIDINRFGSTDLCTPNLDRLCDQGVRMTNFYANSSVSSPSRASLLTGRYPQRVGVPSIVAGTDDAKGIPASEVTLAEVLKENGYATGLVGKWHLGQSEESLPNAQGFDYFFGHRGGCIDNYSHYFYWFGPNRHDLWRNGEEVWCEGENFSDLMQQEAFSFIDKNKDRPFFLYFASNYPHYPLQGDAKWREYYKNTPSPRDKYAGMVSTIDEKIGAVIDHIEKAGLKGKTIILFMSDNGFSTEDRTFYGGGSAGDLRGAKFSAYEGGIRVPAIISYPGRLPQNKACDQVGLGCDWMPTILDLCGIALPNVKLDGVSILPMMTDGKPSPHKVINWDMGRSWAVREGKYKLVGNDTPGKEKTELFDMVADHSEKNDIAAAHPDVVARLLAERTKWLEDVKRK